MGLEGIYSQSWGQSYRGDKRNRGFKAPIGTMHSANPPHSLTPLHKARLNFSKTDGNGRESENFCYKKWEEGVRQNGVIV